MNRQIIQAVILVDASNAFNSLNRNAALHNIQILCPHINKHVQTATKNDSKDIISNEGATQGDNIAMSFYALGTATLLKYLLISSPNVKISVQQMR